MEDPWNVALAAISEMRRAALRRMFLSFALLQNVSPQNPGLSQG